MTYPKKMIPAAALFSIIVGSLSAALVQDQPPVKTTRVKRPVFTQRDWDGVYFENLFEDGLVGPRPSKVDLEARPKPSDTQVSAETPADASFAWSKFIGRDVIENEVKSVQQQLAGCVTTPPRFKSDYAEARQSFSVLSMLFAIIRQYDGEVRWKKDSAAAQTAFARTAANCRVGSQQAYQSAKLRKDDLAELVRGGALAGEGTPINDLDWPTAVDRVPLMKRLEVAFDETLKPATANKTEFVNNLDRVLHESNIVAAIGQVMIQPGMDDAQEDTYSQHARELSQAAQQISLACKSNDFESAAAAANQIGQSCSNCHDQWR